MMSKKEMDSNDAILMKQLKMKTKTKLDWTKEINMQELIILNSSMDLYIKKYGNSENSDNLKHKILDQLINKCNLIR